MKCHVCRKEMIPDLEAIIGYHGKIIHEQCRVGAVTRDILWIVLVILGFALTAQVLNAGTWSMKCDAYGRMVECKSVGVPDNVALMFAAIHEEKKVYRAAGNSISFMVEGKTLYQIEMHSAEPNVTFTLRTWCKWVKDPKDRVHKVMFGPRENFEGGKE